MNIEGREGIDIAKNGVRFGGGAMWKPMAIAIIFGFLFSTVLTLGVIPVLYSVFHRVKFKEFQFCFRRGLYPE